MTVEVSFESSGKLLGVESNEFATYQSVDRAEGAVFGEGNGAIVTADGELVSWKGSGIGKLKERGAVSYRGIVYLQTASQKLARLNNAAGVFEFEADGEGKTHSKTWEWK